MVQVSVVIPTFRRPELLKIAVDSSLDQTSLASDACEIVVVDNSPEGSARNQIEAYGPNGRFDVRYVHEPRPGISRARNAGIKAARGRFIAFLDDDEDAAPGWLDALLGATSHGAQAVFGPVHPRLEATGEPVPTHALRLFRRDFSVPDGSDITRFGAHLGAGNSLFEKAACFAAEEPFAYEYDGLGGEDSDLIFHLVQRGIRLTWAAKALVTEFVPANRLQLGYLAQRSFRNGQIRTFVRYRARQSSGPAWLGWMAVGVIQAGVWGTASVAVWPFRRQAAAKLRLAAAGGLGKIFWMRRFWPISYPSHVPVGQ